MKRLLVAVLILTGLFTLSVSVSAQERINSFKSEIVINKDGTINVTETINYDFGAAYRHGIFRNLPFIKTNEQGKKFSLEYVVEGVSDEKGNKYRYTTSYPDDNLQIKIGDPDKTITGVHTYIIDYKVAGALAYFSDHDELYWNITGNNWTVPIEQTAVTVFLPEEVEASKVNLKCYTGTQGSTAQNCLDNYVDGKVNFQGQQELSAGEGLTIVVAFPKGIVAVLEPKPYTPFWETVYGQILKFVLVCLLIIFVSFWYIFYPIWLGIKWYLHGRDPYVGRPPTAWFDPPKTDSGRPLTPAETGALIDEKVQQRDISALIVDLARRGCFKIEERKKKDFYFIRQNTRKSQKDLLVFEKDLVDGIFDENNEVRLKDKELFTTVEKIKRELYDQLVQEKFFPKNPQTTRTFYLVMMILALTTVNPLLFLSSLIFGRAMPVKTLSGSRAANVARALRNFLSSQERQLKFQADKQLFFEKLLPFAVAFGVEKIWAQRFKDFQLKQPDWYSGYQQGTFNSVIFANSLNSSLNSFASAATPTSSSSGFSSGFSGGSSGGGGGGGGGGSW